MQAIEHGDAAEAGRDFDEDRLARHHRHIAEDDELPAFLPAGGGLPKTRRSDGERAELVGPMLEGEGGVALIVAVLVRVAVEVEMVAARLQPAEGEGDVGAVVGVNVAVEHRVAAGVAPDAGGVRDGEGDGGLGLVGELEAGEEAVRDEGAARHHARVVMRVEIPEVIRREASAGVADLPARRASAEVHVKEDLGVGRGEAEQD